MYTSHLCRATNVKNLSKHSTCVMFHTLDLIVPQFNLFHFRNVSIAVESCPTTNQFDRNTLSFLPISLPPCLSSHSLTIQQLPCQPVECLSVHIYCKQIHFSGARSVCSNNFTPDIDRIRLFGWYVHV